MKKLFILLTTLLVLSGCAAPSTPIAAQSSGGTAVFGTLAAFGTFEMALAPAYTRLAVLRHKAAGALRDKRIGTQQAVDVQDMADTARRYLDEAHRLTLDGKPNDEAKRMLRDAVWWIDEAHKHMGVKP